ncbi:kynureninase, partial [Bacteroidales bacterium AH-315-I05]|nr:kynureninase [Bacteroidales bacterium AH-315-I05]
RPTAKKYKILCEAKAFPSDQYALEGQAKLHEFNPIDAVVEIHPRAGEHIIRTEDILSKIEELGDELSLIMFGGVNYYTGQAFDMKEITEAGHKAGAYVGFDLAHAAGNLKLNLHDWDVDFACWCSYKYLNSGPGSVAGIYVREKHCQNINLPQLAGWWGHDKEKRFRMEKGFEPMATAERWQMSNAPVFSMAAHKVALDIFDEIGMAALCEKRDKLTGYLEFIIDEMNGKLEAGNKKLEIITPRDQNQRGCQLSIIAHEIGMELYNYLTENGVIADWREPDVLRMAPVPLYNSFEDVYRFGEILKSFFSR